MTEAMVTTKVLFFGRLAEQVGRSAEIAIPQDGCTVAELRRRLVEQGDAFAALASAKALAAVDQEMASDQMRVRPGQEIAFFSPLSGG